MAPRQTRSAITLVPPIPAPRSLAHLLNIQGPMAEEKERFMGDISNWTADEIDGAEDRLRRLFPEFFECEKRPLR